MDIDIEKPSKKKQKLNESHIPPYMIKKGYKLNNSWPTIKTDWKKDMKRFHAIQISPVNEEVKLAFIEW